MKHLNKSLNRSLESIVNKGQQCALNFLFFNNYKYLINFYNLFRNSFGLQIVDLLSREIIAESNKVFPKFSKYDRHLELRTLLTVMKANAFCESVNRPLDQDTKLHENQSSVENKKWDDFKVSIIDQFKDILVLSDSDINYKRYNVFGVSLFLIKELIYRYIKSIFFKYWTLLYDIHDHSFGYFKDQLYNSIIMKPCWESISKV